LSEKATQLFGAFYQWTFHKFYFDEIYLFITKKIIFGILAAAIAWFDKYVVDAFMIGVGNVTMAFSNQIKGIQSGKVQDYAMAFVGGVVVLAMVVFYIWIN